MLYLLGSLQTKLNITATFFKNWEATKNLTKNEIISIQDKLSRKYYTGGIDGLIGHKTRRAIGLYQRDDNLKQTCWPPL